MTTTTLGTCVVCERDIAVRTDAGRPTGHQEVLVHHGYRRPGDGMIYGDCFGVGFEPHERSPAAAERWRSHCQTAHDAATQYLAQLLNGHVRTLTMPVRVPVPTSAFRPSWWSSNRDRDPGWEEWHEPFTADETLPERREIWAKLRTEAILATGRRIEFYLNEIARMRRWERDWTRKPLRERPRPESQPRRRRMRRRVG